MNMSFGGIMGLFQKYDVLPKKVDAVQFTDKNKDQIFNELDGNHSADHENELPILRITTVHGDIAVVRLGDWIVKDTMPGTYYPVKNDVFRASYV